MSAMSKSRVRLVPSEGWFAATFRGIPSAFSQGRTRQSATRNVEDAVRCLALAFVECVERGQRQLDVDVKQARAVLRHGKLSRQLRRRLERAIATQRAERGRPRRR